MLLRCMLILLLFSFFFFNDTATTEIYTLSLHDALPISGDLPAVTPQNIGNPDLGPERGKEIELGFDAGFWNDRLRSEEHTSELQSQSNLVCRLLLEKKKKKTRVRDTTKV